MLPGLALFVGFLGCVLVRDYVWAILGFFCGLKEGFHEESKMWVFRFLIWEKREKKDDRAL